MGKQQPTLTNAVEKRTKLGPFCILKIFSYTNIKKKKRTLKVGILNFILHEN